MNTATKLTPPKKTAPTPSASVSDEEFIRLVAEDVRGNLNASQRSILENPKTLETWHSALKTLKMEVENQLSNQNARLVQSRAKEMSQEERLKMESEESSYRARKIKFLVSLNKQIEYVKELKRDESKSSDFYRDAIKRHAEMLDDMDIELSEADLELHSVL